MHTKGISPVIASIILILIVLSLSSAYVVFTGRLAGSQTEAGQRQSQELTTGLTTIFKIDRVEGQDVVLRNIGTQTINANSLAVLMDDTQVNYTMSSDIAQDATGKLTLQGLWRIGPGKRLLKVQSVATSDQMVIEIEPADGNVLDLRFDEESGATAFDSSGNRNNGALVNSPQWVPGKFGSALSFSTGNWVEVPHSASLNPTTMTVELWINPSPLATGYRGLVAKKGPYSNAISASYGYYSVQYHADTRFRSVATNATDENNCIANSYPKPNTWQYLVARFDGTTMQIYVDGIFDNLVNRPDFCYFKGTQTFNTYPLVVGVDNSIGQTGFIGAIDEVRIYNSAYTPDELYVLKTP